MISIIVPIYNVESYLHRCLNSIVLQKNQYEKPYEVILVNDGSTDNSLEIAKEYVVKYGWILINQENQGPSVARNAGLVKSTGDYVWFIDSDDWIREDALKVIYKTIENQDVIAIGYETNYDTEHSYIFVPPKDINTGLDLFYNNFPIGAVFYIYSRIFLNKKNLNFCPNLYHEDFEFTPRMLYSAGIVSTITMPLYYYFKHSNSITTSSNSKRAFDMLEVIKSLSNFRNEINEKSARTKFNDLISLLLNNSMKCSGGISESSLTSYYEAILATNCPQYLCQSSILKYKIEGLCIKYIPKSLHFFCFLQK